MIDPLINWYMIKHMFDWLIDIFLPESIDLFKNSYEVLFSYSNTSNCY